MQRSRNDVWVGLFVLAGAAAILFLALKSANLHGGMDRGIARGSGLIHDAVVAMTGGVTEEEVRALRHKLGVRPVFKRIDTCAAEFEAKTPYMYLSLIHI